MSDIYKCIQLVKQRTVINITIGIQATSVNEAHFISRTCVHRLKVLMHGILIPIQSVSITMKYYDELVFHCVHFIWD